CIPFKGVLVGRSQKQEIRRDVKWEPLDKPFVKLNFDGASKGNPGRSGEGYVLRDWCGCIIKAACCRIPNGFNNITEARALLHGVKLAFHLGIEKIHIEGDSQLITSSLSSHKIVSWEIQYILGEVWKLLPRLQDFKISHCFREGNKLADWLSNEGASLSNGCCEWGSKYLRLLLEERQMIKSSGSKLGPL
ncbi:hypothetical protein SUGI_0911140, partial [Cryptomeria japonica]